MTEPRYLLDSNICIYLLEGLSEAARRRVEQHQPGELVTSAIAYAEVVRGLDLANAAAANLVEALFRVVLIQPFDRAAANAYRTIPFKRGRFDRLIGAHALALDLTMVTNNEDDFRDIPGLRLENWTR
ncbi:type II toxin-antitoxin system VapC family toxin [Sphingomonas sp.]|uniref:type II toxin-antitoxin system VapC family toxin n=1 Tax=Sphingomonas sp. TaxID=28214 RepID=UPI002E2EDDCE|nr:type II toxin-antitoxin system VapC family toxin [Sphingomonas sp.]HEX4693480.1 type II toxin-antitoxin system VapC family toxin [Sphingomonas sp.]